MNKEELLEIGIRYDEEGNVYRCNNCSSTIEMFEQHAPNVQRFLVNNNGELGPFREDVYETILLERQP